MCYYVKYISEIYMTFPTFAHELQYSQYTDCNLNKKHYGVYMYMYIYLFIYIV